MERNNLFAAAESSGSVLIFGTNFSGKDGRESRIMSRGEDAIYEMIERGMAGATKVRIMANAQQWNRFKKEILT